MFSRKGLYYSACTWSRTMRPLQGQRKSTTEIRQMWWSCPCPQQRLSPKTWAWASKLCISGKDLKYHLLWPWNYCLTSFQSLLKVTIKPELNASDTGKLTLLLPQRQCYHWLGIQVAKFVPGLSVSPPLTLGDNQNSYPPFEGFQIQKARNHAPLGVQYLCSMFPFHFSYNLALCI